MNEVWYSTSNVIENLVPRDYLEDIPANRGGGGGLVDVLDVGWCKIHTFIRS